MKSCFNWGIILQWVCPCCFTMQYHSELWDKIKCIPGERVKCQKCHKEITLGDKRRVLRSKFEGGVRGKLVEPNKD